MTRIIIDSTCDLPKELIARFNFAVLPLTIIIDATEYRDGTEIGLDEVYTAMRAGKRISTSQIRWEDAQELFSSIAENGDDFVYLAFSSAMSGTYNLACMVIKELRDSYPGRRMAIVDSRGGSMGAGLIAVQMGLMLERGHSLDEVAAAAMDMVRRVKYAFTIDDLQCAMRGGRLITRAASFGDMLKIKPFMDVQNGTLHLSKLVGGSKQAHAAVAAAVAGHAQGFESQIIGISHADDEMKAQEMQRLLKERLPDSTGLCCRIGGVLGSHLGIGGVGVFCMSGRPGTYYTL